MSPQSMEENATEFSRDGLDGVTTPKARKEEYGKGEEERQTNKRVKIKSKQRARE